MPISQRIKSYLKKNKIGYKILPHRKVYTTFDLAQTLRQDLKKIGKSLLVEMDKKYVIIVLPAHLKLNTQKLKGALKAKKITIAVEKQIQRLLNSTEKSLAPFGGMHGIKVVVDKELTKLKKIIVRSDSFSDSLEIPTRGYIKIEKPIIASVGDKIKGIIKKRIVKKRKK